MNILKSLGAVLAGLILVVVVSILTDMAMMKLGVFPPFDQKAAVIATLYRAVYAVAGSWLAARLAPSRPMTHALVLGAIGFALALVGVLFVHEPGPAWYPIALVVTALPCAWLGGRLVKR